MVDSTTDDAYDPTDLPGQDAERRRKAVRNRQQSLGWVSDLQWIMSSPRGRRWVHWLLGECGVFQLSFRPGQPDMTAFLEGQRNVGQQVYGPLMEHAPQAYLQMMGEAKAALANERSRSRPDDQPDDDPG